MEVHIHWEHFVARTEIQARIGLAQSAEDQLLGSTKKRTYRMPHSDYHQSALLFIVSLQTIPDPKTVKKLSAKYN